MQFPLDSGMPNPTCLFHCITVVLLVAVMGSKSYPFMNLDCNDREKYYIIIAELTV